MEQLMAYIGRDNEERLELLQGGSTVATSAVTRAVFRSSAFCIDTDEDPTIIYFDEDNTILCIKPGLISGISSGDKLPCNLTIWDALSTNGYAWAKIEIVASSWNLCPT